MGLGAEETGVTVQERVRSGFAGVQWRVLVEGTAGKVWNGKVT